MANDPLRDAQAYFAGKVDAYRSSPTHANATELARMLALVAPRPGRRALDVATGGGHTARALTVAGMRVAATDATMGMLRAMRDEAAWRAACDAQALPFRDGAFDVVASRIAPHHFPDLPRFVREASRVLARDGALYVFDLTSPDDVEAARVVNEVERLRDPSHVWSHSPRAWRDACAQAGLAVERLDATHSEFDLEPWLARARMPPRAEAEARRLLAAHPPERLGGYGVVAPGRVRVLRVELLARKP